MDRIMSVFGIVAVLLVAAVPGEGQEVPEADQVSGEEFAGLAWIEGRWLGSGGGYDAFYEAYRILNDSTIEQTTYPDADFQNPDGRSLMVLRGGGIVKTRDGEVESVVTALEGDSLRFERVPPRRGGFSWMRVGADEWRAVLDRPSGEPVVYTLRRIP